MGMDRRTTAAVRRSARLDAHRWLPETGRDPEAAKAYLDQRGRVRGWRRLTWLARSIERWGA